MTKKIFFPNIFNMGIQKRLDQPLPSPPCNFSNKVISCLYCWQQDKRRTLPLTTNYSFWGEISPLTTCKTLPPSPAPCPFPTSTLPFSMVWSFQRRWSWTADLMRWEVKTGFCKKDIRSRQWLISDESRQTGLKTSYVASIRLSGLWALSSQRPWKR